MNSQTLMNIRGQTHDKRLLYWFESKNEIKKIINFEKTVALKKLIQY